MEVIIGYPLDREFLEGILLGPGGPFRIAVEFDEDGDHGYVDGDEDGNDVKYEAARRTRSAWEAADPWETIGGALVDFDDLEFVLKRLLEGTELCARRIGKERYAFGYSMSDCDFQMDITEHERSQEILFGLNDGSDLFVRDVYKNLKPSDIAKKRGPPGFADWSVKSDLDQALRERRDTDEGRSASRDASHRPAIFVMK